MRVQRLIKKRFLQGIAWIAVVLSTWIIFNFYIFREDDGFCVIDDKWKRLNMNNLTNSKCWRLISVEDNIGRLGNNLFQYASMYGVARRYNLIPVIKNSMVLLRRVEVKNIQAKVLTNAEWSKIKWYKWNEPHASSYNQTALEKGLQGNQNVLLERYLQSFRYFEGYEAEVVSQFVFSQTVRDWAFAFVRKVRERMPQDQPNSTIVGIHVRRGDYLLVASKRQGYNTPDEDYYVKAVQYFTSRYAFVAFIVSSTDFDWVNSLIDRHLTNQTLCGNATLFQVTSGSLNQPEKDLAVLSLTNHSILSAGTYSFWSAMLRQYRTGKSDNGTTIYYTKPFVPDSSIASTYGNNVENYYPPSWIGID